MKKLDARSISDLVRLAVAAGGGGERKIAGAGLKALPKPFSKRPMLGRPRAPSVFTRGEPAD
jgi:hypothetical protein